MTADEDLLCARGGGSQSAPIDRKVAAYSNNSARFVVTKRSYAHQYSQLYFTRLMMMMPRLREAVARECLPPKRGPHCAPNPGGQGSPYFHGARDVLRVLPNHTLCTCTPDEGGREALSHPRYCPWRTRRVLAPPASRALGHGVPHLVLILPSLNCTAHHHRRLLHPRIYPAVPSAAASLVSGAGGAMCDYPSVVLTTPARPSTRGPEAQRHTHTRRVACGDVPR